MSAFIHDGFWQPMDTLREKNELESYGLLVRLHGKFGNEYFFWKDKSVFLTGHTGFKGGWLAHWLVMLGAKVHGFSLNPNQGPSFYNATNLEHRLS